MINQTVKLLSKPDQFVIAAVPITVGSYYRVVGEEFSTVLITTDDPLKYVSVIKSRTQLTEN